MESVDVAKNAAAEAAGAVIITSPAAWFWLALLSIALAAIFSFLVFGVNIAEVSANWPKYRCSPTVMPLASFYGYNTTENFNYCVQNIFKGNTGQFTSPFASMLNTVVGALGVIMGSLNSIRVTVATLMGGVTTVFQEIADRFKLLITQMSVTAEGLQRLMGRMFAMMYAIIYMGSSGFTAGLNFGDTAIFSFLDTFCFDPDTKLTVKSKGQIPIRAVEVGDVLPSGAKVTARYEFVAEGQPMVCIPGVNQQIIVSTNHYVKHPLSGRWIRCDEHPMAKPYGIWSGGAARPLICLDTDTHKIEMDGHVFSDYQETEESDFATMCAADEMLNGSGYIPPPKEQDKVKCAIKYTPGLVHNEPVVMKDGSIRAAAEIKLQDELSTGRVLGIVERHQEDILKYKGVKLAACTLVWDTTINYWVRAYQHPDVTAVPGTHRVLNFVIDRTSVIETPKVYMRDLLEVHTEDLEKPTANLMLRLSPELVA